MVMNLSYNPDILYQLAKQFGERARRTGEADFVYIPVLASSASSNSMRSCIERIEQKAMLIADSHVTQSGFMKGRLECLKLAASANHMDSILELIEYYSMEDPIEAKQFFKQAFKVNRVNPRLRSVAISIYMRTDVRGNHKFRDEEALKDLEAFQTSKEKYQQLIEQFFNNPVITEMSSDMIQELRNKYSCPVVSVENLSQMLEQWNRSHDLFFKTLHMDLENPDDMILRNQYEYNIRLICQKLYDPKTGRCVMFNILYDTIRLNIRIDHLTRELSYLPGGSQYELTLEHWIAQQP